MSLPGLYGVRWPRWYVRWRGLRWLERGYCPCCYSSPPVPRCPVCHGNHKYGQRLTPQRSLEWRRRWQRLT